MRPVVSCVFSEAFSSRILLVEEASLTRTNRLSNKDSKLKIATLSEVSSMTAAVSQGPV